MLFHLDTSGSDQPAHTTIAGEVILYYILPVLVLLTLALLSFGVWVVRQINLQKTGLALIIQEVNPPDKPSLRELITDVRSKQSTMEAVQADRDKRQDKGR